MRQKKVWRYYCDHCKKGGCGKAAMIKHELHCIRNPVRECRMCEAGGNNPTPMPEMIALYRENGCRLQPLREAAVGCPACMLATVVQHRNSPAFDPYESEEFYDYKAECTAYWAIINEERREWSGY